MHEFILRCRGFAPAALILWCFGAPLFAQSESVTLPDAPGKLHAILRSDAERFEKILACKKLARIGGSESVPVLAELLSDPPLSHAARIGLEAIPASAAGAALGEAVSQLEGKQLIGVLNSLGARREKSAVSRVKEELGAEDPRVGRAAALALGRIANDEAVRVLVEALANVPAQVKPAVGKACVMAAERCRRDGRVERAKEIRAAVTRSKLPEHIQLGAQRTQLLAADALDADRLAALIKGESEAGFRMALTVAREFPNNGVDQVISAQLDRVPVSRQVRLIKALGDRGDGKALSTVLAAVHGEHEAVRQAAVRALAYFPGQSVCPQLLNMACDPQDPQADAARDALVQMDNPGLDAMVLNELEGADSETRGVLYELIGRRRIAQGVSHLVQALETKNESERLAAIEALGKTLPADQLDVLTDRLLEKTTPQEQQAVLDALREACIRLGDAETCARKIVACLPETSGELARELYVLLGKVGGPTALKAFAKAVKDPSPAMQDTITRVLGEWMTPDAAPLLLQIAKSDIKEKYRIRAIRGYIRILRQFDMTKQERIEMCQKAMPLVERKQERLLMLEALQRVPAPQTLALAADQLSRPAARHRAGEVTLWLSERLVEQHPEAVVQAAEKMLQTIQDDSLKQHARRLLDKAKQKKGN